MDPALPFIELHRHLDGNIRLATMLDLARRHRLKLPGVTIEELSRHVQIHGPLPDLWAFLVRVDLMVSVLADVAACRRIARENVEDAERVKTTHDYMIFNAAGKYPGYAAAVNKLALALMEDVPDAEIVEEEE